MHRLVRNKHVATPIEDEHRLGHKADERLEKLRRR